MYRFYTKKTEKSGYLAWNWIKEENLAQIERTKEELHYSIQRYPKKSEEECFADIVIDIDSQVIELALQEARLAVEWFQKEFALEPEIYFSGRKGFHLIIRDGVFKLENIKDLNLFLKFVVSKITNLIPITQIDFQIFAKKKIIRAENSIHLNSKLFKIPLTSQELLTSLPSYIKALAKSQREIPHYKNEYNDKFQTFILELFQEWKELPISTEIERELRENLVKEDLKNKYPPCIETLLTKGFKEKGMRNKVVLLLSSFFFDIGLSRSEAEIILTNWSLNLSPELSDSSMKERVAHLRATLNQVYTFESYHFSCYFAKIYTNCNEKACFLKNPPIQYVRFPDALDCKYERKKIRTNILVTGDIEAPFFAPNMVRIKCEVSDCKDKFCDKYKKGATLAPERLALFEGISEDSLIVATRKALELKKSCKYSLEILNKINLETVVAVNPAEYRKTEEDIISRKDMPILKIYHQFDKEPLQIGQKYEAEGIVFANPRTQSATFIITRKQNIAQDWRNFKLTPELNERFEAFFHLGNSVRDRISHILQEVNYFVRIIGRNDALFLALLTYFSPLYLSEDVSFGARTEDYISGQRGWLEILLIGSSGVGKSAIVTALRQLIGYGWEVSGSSATRTGLAWTIEHLRGGESILKLGKFPLADQQLLVIDEAQGISKSDWAQLRQFRENRGKVDRQKTRELTSRVRLIVSANPRGGKSLTAFKHRIEVLDQLFYREDYRRFDCFLLLFQDVEEEKLVWGKRNFSKQEPFLNPELLRLAVSWVWTRERRHIKWDKTAINLLGRKTIYLSKRLHSESHPIAARGDLEEKLARGSQSLAALVHSTDTSGENIIVKPEHVLFYTNFLDQIYTKNSMLVHYVSLFEKGEKMTINQFEEIKNEITQELNHITWGKGNKFFENLTDFLSKRRSWNLKDVEILLGIEKNKAIEILNCFMKRNLIDKSDKGYDLTEKKGLEFLQFFIESKLPIWQEEVTNDSGENNKIS